MEKEKKQNKEKDSLDTTTEKRSPKRFAADTAVAVGSIRKILDVVPTLERFDWFDTRLFDQQGLLELAMYYGQKYNLGVKHILTVLNEGLEKLNNQPLPELKKPSVLQQILDAFPGIELLKADGLDDAILGVVMATTKPRLVYSVEKCVQVMMAQDGMSYGEAFDFLCYNTFDAWVGEQTPIWYYDTDERADDAAD